VLYWDFTQRRTVVFFTDIAGQPIEDCLTLEDATNRLFRNVGKKLITFYAAPNPKTLQCYLYCDGSLKSR